MVDIVVKVDDTSGVGQRGNSHGFDHSRSEQAAQQLQELMQMETQPKRFAVIKNYIKRITRERLDTSDTGKNQLPTMKIIGDQLKNEFPRDFGPVAPKNEARLYYAIRCAFQFHRANRSKHLRQEEENKFPAARRARKKKHADTDVEEIPRPALTKLKGNTKNFRQTTLRDRMALNLAGTQVMQQDMFPCTDPFQPAPPIVPGNCSNTQVVKPREVIVIDDPDNEDVQTMDLPIRLPSRPQTVPKLRSFAERPNMPTSLIPTATTSSPVLVKVEPLSTTRLSLPCPPSSSQDKSIDIPAIKNFLEHYCSPPMTEFLARFIDNGIRNIVRLESVAGWTPEMRLELLQGLPASPDGFPVTYLDILVLQRAFTRLHGEKVANQ